MRKSRIQKVKKKNVKKTKNLNTIKCKISIIDIAGKEKAIHSYLFFGSNIECIFSIQSLISHAIFSDIDCPRHLSRTAMSANNGIDCLS